MTTMRPSRQKKSDRLISPGATSSEIQCDYAIAPFDRVATEYDRKWGVDRLPELVAPDLAAKYGAAMAYLNECINDGDADNVAAAATNCIRGMHAMDAAAIAAGHQPSDPTIWEYTYEGRTFGVIEDGREWPAAYAKRPGLTIFTMREVAVALSAPTKVEQTLDAIKQHFPGAALEAIEPFHPDETIPF